MERINFDEINFKNYKPIRDGMFIHKLKVRIFREPSYINCFKINITKDFFETLYNLFDENVDAFTSNTIIQISGLSGTGKSIGAMSLAKITCPTFSEKYMYFFDQQIIDSSKTIPPKNYAIRDENSGKAIYGQGSNRLSSQIKVIADSCRKFGLSLIFIEPEFKLNSVAKWYLETIDMGNIDGKRFVRMGVKEPSTLMFIGCVFIPVVDENDKDWVDYNNRKDFYIDNVMSGEFKGSKIDLKDEADKILEEIDEEIYRTYKEKMFYITEKYPNLTTGELQSIMIALKIRQNEKRKSKFLNEDTNLKIEKNKKKKKEKNKTLK